MTRLEDDYLGYRAIYKATEASTSLSASSSQLDWCLPLPASATAHSSSRKEQELAHPAIRHGTL